MKIDYIIADPTGNITALILTPVPPALRPRVAAALMRREPSVEQAGFLSLTDRGVELRMAGGEFCGNATLSAAAVYAGAFGLRAGEKIELPVHVSGAPESVRTSLEALADGSFSGTVDMPRALSLNMGDFPLGGRSYRLPVVKFPGITHMISPFDMDARTAERAAREWCAVLEAPALGLMLFDEEKHSLKPLVYVPAADTLFWESSCASGTAAVGTWVSARRGGGVCSLTLSEPGGSLSIEAGFVSGLLRLGGSVRLRARKIAEKDEN